MDIALYIETLKTTFLPYVKSIQDFHFYYDNPLLWLFFITLFFLLVWFRDWSRRRSFSFCLASALVLLTATWVEGSMAGAFSRAGESFDPFIIRALFILALSGVAV